MGLKLTHHAVEQFATRWRPQAPLREAEKELEVLVAGAGATSKRTLCGDARLYIATSPEGERIHLAVREGAVITVLQARPDEVDMSVDMDLYEEHLADRREQQARLAHERPEIERPQSCETVARPPLSRSEAKGIIQDWKNGRDVNRSDLRRAHKVLGLSFTAQVERIVEQERAVYRSYLAKA